ncbi:hypothetical protein AB833_19325 [Chromatiales bacterium (ex Bugula neritina AB1)]|nr:hypothetical protein AB833_19325 [Chromatiales bacterium (ex Bugula neritina AB1)]
MAYVDLNPIRAKIAETPAVSDHTSVKLRIEACQSQGRIDGISENQPKQLQPFAESTRDGKIEELPFRLQDYLELVDWTGRQMREDKPGQIEETVPPILNRLNLDADHWLYMTRHYQSSFKSLVGCVQQVREACRLLGWKKSHSLSMCRALIG